MNERSRVTEQDYANLGEIFSTQIYKSMTDSAVDTVHQNIHQRQSIGHLVEPAPNAEQLEKAFQAALTAPDHHRLKPTRFVVISNDQREAFGELLSRALADLGETDPVQLDRVKNHPFRAPLLVLALTQFQPHPKVPDFEQTLSSGAAIENFLLSLQAQGFSTCGVAGQSLSRHCLSASWGCQKMI